MNPELIIVDTNKGFEALLTYLEDTTYVAYDIETTGVHHGAEVVGLSVCADEDKSFYVIIKAWNAIKSVLEPIINQELIEVLLQTLKGKHLWMHNGVFDAAHTHSNFKISLINSLHTDTMILAHLLNENRRVGLKELAKEYFGEDSTKEQTEMKASVIANGGVWSATNKEMYKADPQVLAKYGAKDAWLTYKLALELIPELEDQGLYSFFYEDESMPLLRGPTYDLNTTGLRVDQPALTTLKKTLEAECMEAKDFIHSEIKSRVQEKYPGTNKKNGFNIGSNQQLSWLLFGIYGFEFGTLTDSGKDICKHLGLRLPYTFAAKRDFIAMCQNSNGRIYQPEAYVNGKKVRAKKVKDPWCYIAVDKKVLTKLAPRAKWIERLLEYQRKNKILNTYVNGIEERIQYAIIRPSFLQSGTSSGRYASRSPNFQNLPRDDKRIKQSIVARQGKTLVGADYSQLEPRVFAYYSKDAKLLAGFKSADDFYSVIGIETFDKYDATPRKEGSPDAFGVKYKQLRDVSKVIALASTYGSTAFQLAPTIGKSVEETQEVINDYFEKFPGVRQMMLESHEMAKKDGQVVNLFGRPRRIPEAKQLTKLYGNVPHAELPYVARSVLNLAVNHRIQSTAASIVNRSAIRFHNDCITAGIDCKLVLQVHDSLIVECNIEDAEDVSILLQNAMETTISLNTVSLEAIPKIGNNLAKV